ncbi:CDP-alcohol phosphatidyltransferase-domain-containing protein [Melampsora americana]|nr:CDP-alcohol phosphatidyltransferase-domain-containing protein [Melampsora americana]
MNDLQPINLPSTNPQTSSSSSFISSVSSNSNSDPPRTDENIFLFVPNLIGYSRIILAAVSLHYMSYHPKYCTIAYLISQLLDAVDGQAARALGQTSRFGAVLDMVTDRCTTSCLLCFLSSVYPTWAIMFQSLIALDFASHYIHMYSSMVAGSKSHKTVSKKQSRILHSYYTNSNTLFIFCACNEIFFVCLYLAHWYKPIIHSDLTFHLTWPELMAILMFPICFGKQLINVIQFWKASKLLVLFDQEERWKNSNSKRL